MTRKLIAIKAFKHLMGLDITTPLNVDYPLNIHKHHNLLAAILVTVTAIRLLAANELQMLEGRYVSPRPVG